MTVSLWQAIVACIASSITMLIGVLIYQDLNIRFRKHQDARFFNQPGLCNVLYVNCTSPAITLSSTMMMGEVKIWEDINPTHFCTVPSPLRVPCWWSKEGAFLGYVRIGPMPPSVGQLQTLSIVLIAVSSLFVFVSLAYPHLNDECIPRWLRWGRREDDPNRQQRQDDQGGTQMDVLVLEETRLTEVYPMSDENWKAEAIARTPYAKMRLKVLERFFNARRRHLQHNDDSSQPYAGLTGSDSELECDDDDLRVDECYICLSRSRRRIIWWPCGHWLCASCLRKVLRKTFNRGYVCCPNCRSLVLREDLLILHLLPRVMSTAA
ncbi:hypothetical protein TraAM80_02425 [Trypanosoma rangeli]|uniref:RING-type domain-containing protein n=1 Tax=Trypanosoma rangeli TaxID=5698 RepID=A0A3R7KK00_TRYRA|nr:uncharacterized protein TraAM80_02425 [Trypanosoma rangeli]RNF09028.1 hypothetical protein TraAM80_02425 [Trypanosoma rangeli]|eukprot:RNF09028.1 hypothetical protein TraAM80_02425 [Trypanosoma rangeli]